MYKISQTGNKYYYTLTQSCKAFWKDVQLILWNSVSWETLGIDAQKYWWVFPLTLLFTQSVRFRVAEICVLEK